MSPLPRGTGAVLLDIEGTTTPLSFVTEVLFPYARTHLRSYLAAHAAAPDHTLILERLHQDHLAAVARGDAPPPWLDAPPPRPLEFAAAFAEWLMDRDSKSTPLKELQGLIWAQGYERGLLAGQVFPDVAPAFGRWRDAGIPASIYSSGSALAQQLLFRYSSAGDLTPLVASYFDTAVGGKRDAGSYTTIAARLQRPVDAVLFLSDVPAELEAARCAGMDVRLVVRPGNASVAGHGYTRVETFDEL